MQLSAIINCAVINNWNGKLQIRRARVDTGEGWETQKYDPGTRRQSWSG